MNRILAILSFAISAIFLGGAASLAIDAASGKEVSDSIGGAVVLLVFAGSGILLALRALRRKRPRSPKLRPEERERIALERARLAGGKLTQAELALDGGLGLEEAGRLLDSLASRGIAEIEVGPSGAVVYAFPGLGDSSEKDAAKPVMQA